MVYKTVYSPEGECFEVIRDRANHLILQHGWTQSAPIVETKKAKNSYRAKKSIKTIKADEEVSIESVSEVFSEE